MTGDISVVQQSEADIRLHAKFADAEHESDTSTDEISDFVQDEIASLKRHFQNLDSQYQILGRIGEGTFSTVYKAIDLRYDDYVNDWDVESRLANKWSSPPLKRVRVESQFGSKIKRKYVALKRIYVTSSPARIYNELKILHDLSGCDNVVHLVTAFRFQDQIIAVLPYCEHKDFRDYYRVLPLRDVRRLLRSLFEALRHVHSRGIIHRDIKPSNFLYNVNTRRGVLVDFGLAERETIKDRGRQCPCRNPTKRLEHEVSLRSYNELLGQPVGYLKNDTRPIRRANRAGTRGFRAPEVLFKCPNQTSKIDIWAAGVILLSILTKRFPFFNSSDDVEALLEIATLFGKSKMRHCAKLHDCTFEVSIPGLTEKSHQFSKLIKWASSDTARPSINTELDWEMQLAVNFLTYCLHLDPLERFSAEQALEHKFLAVQEDEFIEDDVFLGHYSK